MNTFPLLSILTFVPLVGGIVIVGLKDAKMARRLALLFSFGVLALAVVLWKSFDQDSGELQLVERFDWIPSLGVHYFVGVDGLGLLMVMLTAIVTPLAILASRNVTERVELYYGLMLFLQAGLMGTFTALNFFHWFVYWELGLIPAFFLVRLWGGANRGPAATQFFVYTMVGSVAMLLAFLGIFAVTHSLDGQGVFDFMKLSDMGSHGGFVNAIGGGAHTTLFGYALGPHQIALWIFFGVLLGFAVKVPLMPFHTWLPSTYAEAPSPVTMMLTGVMSKMGVYGFIRILLPIFPNEISAMRTPLLVLAVVTIVCSACAAFAQKDIKRMLAYSSINHLGYCLLGIFAVATAGANVTGVAVEKSAALNGVFLQMFNHGLTAAVLFMFVSFLEQRSGGLRGLNDFGGLRKVAPVLCGLMGIALFSSLGLPGLNGFVGEFLIFKGVFPLTMWSAAISVIGLLVTAIFILTLLQRVFNGPLNAKWAKLPDLTLGERAMVGVPLVLMFVLGVYPQLVLGAINNTVTRMVELLNF